MRGLVGQVFGFRLGLSFDGAVPRAVRFSSEARPSAAGDALMGWVFEGGSQRWWWGSGCGFDGANFFVVAPAMEAPVFFTGC